MEHAQNLTSVDIIAINDGRMAFECCRGTRDGREVEEAVQIL